MNEKPSPDIILQEALEIVDSHKRAEFLNQVCGTDEVLREEIESLLAAHFAADDSFMDTLFNPEWKAEQGGAFGNPIPTVDELAADFPELEIIELIGRGGMGAVFKARQASLDRFVALKVLPGDWKAAGNFPERFEREAKILAGLNHPGIVTIHEFGERNGRYFFTMEFVDGTDLERMIRSGELTPNLGLKLIPQICDAIQFAHDRGVVHRDIKPGNILVDRNGRVKVADFGIAMLGGSRELDFHSSVERDSQTSLTDPNWVVGTPRYMAPEQAASGEVDHRADLYALGVVFYEMLVGELPAKGTLTVPSLRRGKVDRCWERIVLRALAEDPDRRYQNASEIRTAVEAVLAEQRRFIPRWAKAAALVVIVLVALYAWPRKAQGVAAPLENSLKMRFVPVPGVNGLVSVWETRVKDYAVFVKETVRSANSPGFEQSGDHPAVNVSWHEARAFCQWLTDREHKSGLLPSSEVYRLPTDREWSAMAHLPLEAGVIPKDRHLVQGTIFSWGENAPIPPKSGNFPDLSAHRRLGSATVAGYMDDFAATAPVGRFRQSADGLYDLGGNVWEWTSTPFSPDDDYPALRGGGWWADQADDGWKSLLASYRRADVEATDTDAWDVGFRVVRGPDDEEQQGNDLFRLILKGDHEGVLKMIVNTTDLNAANRAGQPPIVLAANSGDLEMVKLLHEKGADLEASDRRGRTPLHAAAENGDIGLLAWLLDNGANPRARTITGDVPLMLAVAKAPVALLDRILAASDPETLLVTNSVGNSPFLQACLKSSDETLKWIIAQLSPEQIRKISSTERGGYLMLLAARDGALLSGFIKKAPEGWSPQVLLQAMTLSIMCDREENYNMLGAIAGENAFNEEWKTQIATIAACTGRPWALKSLFARGWDLKMSDGKVVQKLLFSTLGQRDELRSAFESFVPKTGEGKGSDSTKDLWNHLIAAIPQAATRETIRILAKAGCDIEVRDQRKRTPLLAAAMEGNVEAVETLLDLGAAIEAKYELGFTPLLCAVEKGNLEVVKELDRRGADFKACSKGGRGALHNVHRNVEVLRYLLTKNLPIEARDDYEATPLNYLASEGDERIIAIFLDAGANVNATGGEGEFAGSTPLHFACMVRDKADLDGLDTAVALGGPKMNPIPAVANDERLRSVKLMMAAGANPVAKNAEWITPLHLAAGSGLANVVELFLQGGADPNAITKALTSPMHHAAMNGHVECARLLIAHGAMIDSPLWQTPLATAALNSRSPDMLKMLLDHKAPLGKRDLYGAYPLHRACYNGQVEMVELILDAGADPDVRDFNYWTPLHMAAKADHRDIVELLWKHGARMDAQDQFAMTPAQTATGSGNRALGIYMENLAKNPKLRAVPKNNQPESNK